MRDTHTQHSVNVAALLVSELVAHAGQQLAHLTGAMDTRVALTVIDVCLTVGAGKADHTCALVPIDNVLWYSFHIRERTIRYNTFTSTQLLHTFYTV